MRSWIKQSRSPQKSALAGDRVLVFVRACGPTARDSVLVSGRGKVAAIRFYLDRAEALEAVGLSE